MTSLQCWLSNIWVTKLQMSIEWVINQCVQAVMILSLVNTVTCTVYLPQSYTIHIFSTCSIVTRRKRSECCNLIMNGYPICLSINYGGPISWLLLWQLTLCVHVAYCMCIYCYIQCTCTFCILCVHVHFLIHLLLHVHVCCTMYMYMCDVHVYGVYMYADCLLVHVYGLQFSSLSLFQQVKFLY